MWNCYYFVGKVSVLNFDFQKFRILEILSFHPWLSYNLLQVDENGKITRLRRECPNEDCGAGVFMASHFDRQYCGKCCLTYVFNKPDDK